jgi:hypothetical protein
MIRPTETRKTRKKMKQAGGFIRFNGSAGFAFQSHTSYTGRMRLWLFDFSKPGPDRNIYVLLV